MTKEKEQDLIYEEFLNYKKRVHFKSGYSQEKAKRIWQEKSGMLGKLALYSQDDSQMDVQKQKLTQKAKQLFVEYCRCKSALGSCISSFDEKQMAILLHNVSAFEQERLENYRKKVFAGERIQLQTMILSNQSFCFQLINQSIDQVVNQTLFLDIPVGGTEKKKLYITRTGKKYHLLDCPYCKNVKELQAISKNMIEHMDFVPCNCVLAEEKKKQYRTIFIDESIRENPLKSMDKSLADLVDEKQGSYSYIISEGCLESETEITEENTVCTGHGLLEETIATTGAAIEVIGNVLMKLAFSCDFSDHVVIYTDNTGARDAWLENPKNAYLSDLFKSVEVRFVPREKNKVADKIGRKEAYFNMPVSAMKKILHKCQVYDKIAKNF